MYNIPSIICEFALTTVSGDVSMTRQDAAIGDNRNFQVDLYDEVSTPLASQANPFLITSRQLLVTLGQFGNDSAVTGNRSVFNERVMGEFKFRRFVEDQKANKMVRYLPDFVIISDRLLTTWSCSFSTTLDVTSLVTGKLHSL